MEKIAVIIAPFWGDTSHVGVYRVERFIRWFANAGMKVILIRAGALDKEAQQSWGLELTVRDPIGLYRDATPTGEAPKPRKPNKLRRQLALWLFNPDAGVVWAKRLAEHPTVLHYAKGAEFILSSSRPESAHVAAWQLAKQLKCKLVIDMRDGWLDEPLEPLLITSPIRRYIEGRLEKKILADAQQIFVTSEVWKELLVSRGVASKDKVEVITNAYPTFDFSSINLPTLKQEAPKQKIELLHTGRFRASRSSQDPALLLEPILAGLTGQNIKGRICLLGNLEPEELEQIAGYQAQLAQLGWEIECQSSVPRAQAMARIGQTNGLLLLCAVQAAIPSKIFEYIPSRKPILIVAKEGSAVWRVGKTIKQATLLDYRRPETWDNAMADFFKNVLGKKIESNCPEMYSEDYLGKRVLACLEITGA